MRKILSIAVLLICALGLKAQETYPVNGTVEKDIVYTALTNVSAHLSPTETLEKATILILREEIVAVGTDIKIPAGAVIHQLTGKHVYPAFIDLYSNLGMPNQKKREWSPSPQYDSNRKGAFGWNQALMADTDAASIYSTDQKSAESYRSLGFGAVLSHLNDGIARGTGTLVCLRNNESTDIIKHRASAHFSLDKGSSSQKYPSSLMGSIALLRQFFYDAQWYGSTTSKIESNLVLEALNQQWELPWFIESESKWTALRADKIGDEFSKQFVIKGNGDEYQRLDELKASGATFIVPLNYPVAFDLTDPFLSRMVSLAEMKDWEMTPANLGLMEAKQIPFCITTFDLKDKKSFFPNLRKAVEYGLSKEAALNALTCTPAMILGVENQLGKIASSYKASFSIWDNDLFEKDASLLETWVSGERYKQDNWDELDISGTYNLTIEQTQYEIKLKKGKKKSAAISHILINGAEKDTLRGDLKVEQDNHLITMSFQLDKGPHPGIVRLAGNIHTESRIWDGKAQLEDGKWAEWVAVRQASEVVKSEQDSLKADTKSKIELGEIWYPMSAYGWDSLPSAEIIHIKNATIWTCESEGKIENAEMLIRDGKILAVGSRIDMNNLFPKAQPTIKVIDAKGKHITPGIIDEHSHIAISRGVNESAQTSSAEVSIADVINPDDIDIYRQLAGGVTTSQLLHGSANPIGGQSAIIKLRWGRSAEEMKVEYAAPFIKFALGENVKQSNWGDFERERFPQTRMGVEQVFYDYFISAREYGERMEKYDSAQSGKKRKKNEKIEAPRRDLELETLYQILKSERFITCHSYQQGEINMLMHVADSMGFRLNTFTHILEGYKVADKMAEHGAGGSTFSDWWAYKMEVKDAIPYNGALLWENGVVTAFNSDDAEMARRLNQEAGKAMKYGNVPEEEALKFVTLNPAKLLHLDEHIGSLKAGKDADFVIWSDHPLSIYAKAEKTFIDGICYFDDERDEQLRERMRLERARITQKMLGAKAKGEETRQPEMKPQKHYHCDTLGEEMEENHEH